MSEKKRRPKLLSKASELKNKIFGRLQQKPARVRSTIPPRTSTPSAIQAVSSTSRTGSIPPTGSHASHRHVEAFRAPPSKDLLYQLAWSGRDNEYALQILRDYRHTHEWWEVLHTCVLTAAQGANIAFMEEMLALGADMGSGIRDDERHTALHVAARSGKREMVKWLLAHGADPWAVNDRGETAKDVAEGAGHRGCAISLRLAMPGTTVGNGGG